MRNGYGFFKPLFHGVINFEIWKQETPVFSYIWKWKRYRFTLEFGFIVFGYWFSCLIDYN